MYAPAPCCATLRLCTTLRDEAPAALRSQRAAPVPQLWKSSSLQSADAEYKQRAAAWGKAQAQRDAEAMLESKRKPEVDMSALDSLIKDDVGFVESDEESDSSDSDASQRSSQRDDERGRKQARRRSQSPDDPSPLSFPRTATASPPPGTLSAESAPAPAAADSTSSPPRAATMGVLRSGARQKQQYARASSLPGIERAQRRHQLAAESTEDAQSTSGARRQSRWAVLRQGRKLHLLASMAREQELRLVSDVTSVAFSPDQRCAMAACCAPRRRCITHRRLPPAAYC